MSTLWLLICGASFGAVLFGHAIVCRANAKLNRVTSFVIVAALVTVLMVAALAQHYEFVSAEFIAALLLFAFACELYVFLFTMTISSISANILVLLAHKPMSVEDVRSRYDSRNMVRMRLERLVQNGFLEMDGSRKRLSPSPKGVWFTRAFTGLRILFRFSSADE
jgi:hypothetical protein